MSAPEFIYLNEQAVRVTSWNQDRDGGIIEFILIAKGERDRDLVLDMLEHSPVMVRIGSGSAIPMDVRALDTRSTGEGTGSVHRLQVVLGPEGASAKSSTPASGQDSTSTLNEKLDRMIAILTEIRDELRLLK